MVLNTKPTEFSCVLTCVRRTLQSIDGEDYDEIKLLSTLHGQFGHHCKCGCSDGTLRYNAMLSRDQASVLLLPHRSRWIDHGRYWVEVVPAADQREGKVDKGYKHGLPSELPVNGQQDQHFILWLRPRDPANPYDHTVLLTRRQKEDDWCLRDPADELPEDAVPERGTRLTGTYESLEKVQFQLGFDYTWTHTCVVTPRGH